jgi:hypothetical protein
LFREFVIVRPNQGDAMSLGRTQLFAHANGKRITTHN